MKAINRVSTVYRTVNSKACLTFILNKMITNKLLINKQSLLIYTFSVTTCLISTTKKSAKKHNFNKNIDIWYNVFCRINRTV